MPVTRSAAPRRSGQAVLMAQSPEVLPSLNDLRAMFLHALRSEGDEGLWEIVWSLNTEAPSASLESKVALAREMAFALMDEGVVTLQVAEWPQPATAGRALTTAELVRLRHDLTPWSNPENAPELTVWVCEDDST
jgi:hypothetical protein